MGRTSLSEEGPSIDFDAYLQRVATLDATLDNPFAEPVTVTADDPVDGLFHTFATHFAQAASTLVWPSYLRPHHGPTTTVDKARTPHGAALITYTWFWDFLVQDPHDLPHAQDRFAVDRDNVPRITCCFQIQQAWSPSPDFTVRAWTQYALETMGDRKTVLLDRPHVQQLTWIPMDATSSHGPDALWHFDKEGPWSLRDALLALAAEAATLPSSIWLRHADRITWGQRVRTLLTPLGRGRGAGLRAIFSDEFLLIVLILVFFGIVLWVW